MPDSHINFVYKLDGDVEQVDVFQLAPTLLALGELIQDSNRELNPNGREIAVNVKPFRPGSFVVDLVVFAQSNLQQLFDALNSHSAEQVKNLLEWVGLITGTGGLVGVVQVIRWLKGKPQTIEEVGRGEVRYTNADGATLTVGKNVHQLFSNSRITHNVYNVYGAPMEKQPAITDVKTYLEGNENSQVSVPRSEISALKEWADTPSLSAPEDKTNDKVLEGIYLNPKRGAFGGDPKDWSFFRGDKIITATIKDKEFLSRYANGEIRLNQTDLLTVTLLDRQRLAGTRVQKPIYEILKVTGYIKGEGQSPLPFESAD